MKNMTTINTNIKTFNQMTNENAVIMGGKKYALIPVTEMFVDTTYQRLVQAKAPKIAKEWDDKKCKMLELSYRADLDKYAIIDGQNRWTASKMIGITHLNCQIYENLTIEEEAKIFAEQNDNVTRIASADKFKSLLIMGDEACLQIKSLCDEFGISIRKTYGDTLNKIRKNLNGIESAKRIVKQYGIESLRWIFTVIEKSGWDLTARSYSYKSLQILLDFYLSCYKKETFNIDTEKLINLYANLGEYNGLVNHANKYVLDRTPRNDRKAFTEREAILCYIEHMVLNK